MTQDSIKPDAELDCVGLYCPMPIARTKEEIENVDIGRILKVDGRRSGFRGGYTPLDQEVGARAGQVREIG